MRRRTFITATAAFLATTGAAQAGTLYVNSPNDGKVKLRTGPGKNYSVIRDVKNGTKLTSYESAGQWVRVKTPNGAVGWVYGPHTASSRGIYYTVISENNYAIELHSGPGKDYPSRTSMREGDRVQLLEKSGQWRKVYHIPSGKRGWVRRTNLVD